MKALITGASGLVGSALTRYLKSEGDEVSHLVRRSAGGDQEITWDPAQKTVDAGKLEGFDVVYHLAGENIAEGRWSEAKKARIRDSRIDGTTFLSETLAALSQKPATLVSASAIGYYGDRGAKILHEGSGAGEGYLPDVSAGWESSTSAAAKAGIRVVNPRIGIVLSKDGGALARMLPPFKMGVGGILGDGSQYMSWITLDDLISVLRHCATTDTVTGPVNAVAPNPVTNAEYTKALSRALIRPAIFPIPAFVARLAFGEMADALLLASTRVSPTALISSGYAFRHGNINQALQAVL